MYFVAELWVLVTHGVRKITNKSLVMIKVLWWYKRTTREYTYQDYVVIQSNDTRKSRGSLVDTERRTLNEMSNASECWRMRLLRGHARADAVCTCTRRPLIRWERARGSLYLKSAIFGESTRRESLRGTHVEVGLHFRLFGNIGLRPKKDVFETFFIAAGTCMVIMLSCRVFSQNWVNI